jgi:hypothetical protein
MAFESRGDVATMYQCTPFGRKAIADRIIASDRVGGWPLRRTGRNESAYRLRKIRMRLVHSSLHRREKTSLMLGN